MKKIRNQKNTIMSFIIVLLIAAAAPLSIYASVLDYENHWAAEFIEEACNREWVSGYPDGTFRPNDSITRAEFSSMLWQALDLEITTNDNPFTDVAGGAWYYESAVGLYNAGVVAGYGNGIYAPNDLLTREMAFTMLANAFDLTASDIGACQAFTDYQDISSWAVSPISAMTEKGYVSGIGDGYLAPQDSMTRAEMATILIIVFDGEQTDSDQNSDDTEGGQDNNNGQDDKDDNNGEDNNNGQVDDQENDSPTVTISKTEGVTDYSDAIQDAFYEASELDIPVEFENGTYYVSTNIIIPDRLEIKGNGATIAIDSNNFDSFTLAENPQYGTRYNYKYKGACILNEGMLTREKTTFSIDSLKFVLQDDSGEKNIPTALFSVEYMENVSITNCEFSTYSANQISHTIFDAGCCWNNLYISGCIFNELHEGQSGGMWIRNFQGAEKASDALIENCIFNNKSGDEVLAVWAATDGELSDVTVRNCEFYCFNSEIYNPVHFITLGNTGNTTDIVFEDNYIYMEAVWNSVIKMTSFDPSIGSSDKIFVRNNTIVVDDIMVKANEVIMGDTFQRTAVVENNSITVNTNTGIVKNGVTGRYTRFLNNEFYGNGFDNVFYNVRYAEGNTIEQCVNGFIGILECANNTVLECTGDIVFITASAYTPSRDDWQEIRITGNEFYTSNLAFIRATSSTELYCNVILENNLMKGGRIWSGNDTAALALYDNEFYMRDLNDIVFHGGVTEMSNNKLRDTNGEPLVSQTLWPKGVNFNSFIPVGLIIEIEPAFIDTSIANPIVAYQKIAEGTGEETWKPIYSSEASD